MPEEFESINDRMPDIASVLAQRIASKKAEAEGNTLPPPGTVDPYKLMVQKKNSDTAPINPDTIQKWPEEDVEKLRDYCQKTGIVGFNSGRMPPIAALAMLKRQFGDYSGVPLEERIPAGYEKQGTHSGHGPNYPYTDARKKQILHG